MGILNFFPVFLNNQKQTMPYCPQISLPVCVKSRYKKNHVSLFFLLFDCQNPTIDMAKKIHIIGLDHANFSSSVYWNFRLYDNPHVKNVYKISSRLINRNEKEERKRRRYCNDQCFHFISGLCRLFILKLHYAVLPSDLFFFKDNLLLKDNLLISRIF